MADPSNLLRRNFSVTSVTLLIAGFLFHVFLPVTLKWLTYNRWQLLYCIEFTEKFGGRWRLQGWPLVRRDLRLPLCEREPVPAGAEAERVSDASGTCVITYLRKG